MTEIVAPSCSVKTVFLEILQNSQENTCARVSFLIKVQASDLELYPKETLAQAFSCDFLRNYETPILQNTLERLLQ